VNLASRVVEVQIVALPGVKTSGTAYADALPPMPALRVARQMVVPARAIIINPDSLDLAE
jgi:hypothetical protein